jgi:hypothetical protein
MPAGKSYFGNTGLELVPIAASAPSAIIGPLQSAELMVNAKALT